jgi:hypothetical protein
MVGDLTNDAISYSAQRMGLILSLMANLRDQYEEEGETYHAFKDAFNILVREYRNAAKVVSRYVGGVYIDRSFVGQKGGGTPLTPVSYEDQKRAMSVLKEHVFAPETLLAPNGIYDYLRFQRRGWNYRGGTEDPKLHEQMLGVHKTVLDHLLHSVVLARIDDSALYENEYSLTEFMADMTEAVFAVDVRGDINSFRRNLQVEYVIRLAGIINGGNGSSYNHLVKATAYQNLLDIRKMVARKSGDETTTAHREYVVYLIDSALDEG